MDRLPHVVESIDIETAKLLCDGSQPPEMFDLVVYLSVSMRSGTVAIDVESLEGMSIYALLSESTDYDSAKDTFCKFSFDRYSTSSLVTRFAHGQIIGPEVHTPVVIQGKWIYFRRYWIAEQHILESVIHRSNHVIEFENPESESVLDIVIPDIGGKTTSQRNAVRNALRHNFSIITGGPGTGKTRTIIAIIASFLERDPNLNIALCAPTGKAASRVIESVSHQLETLTIDRHILDKIPRVAKTLHRLVGWNPSRGSFAYNRENQLDLDLLVVDEASMVDLPMFSRLLHALPAECRIVLIGDKNQLASVDAGAIFGDLATSPRLANIVTELDYSWRFESASAIGSLASSINQGESLSSLQMFREFDDISMLSHDVLKNLSSEARLHHESICSCITDNMNDISSVTELYRVLHSHQILTAHRHGPQGSIRLNELIDRSLIEFMSEKGHKTNGAWYHGRPVIAVENDYELGIFNGDIGITIDTGERLMVLFGMDGSAGALRWFTPSQVHHVESAWALTVHKSQGSEYDSVTLVLPVNISQVLGRELIYTGITRARKSVRVISSADVWTQALSRSTIRPSGFRECLK